MLKRLSALLLFCWAANTATAETYNSDQVLDFLDSRSQATATLAKKVWDLAELGYQETQSSELLAAELEAAGFDVKMGVAGIPTAFVASYGRRGPVLAILAEFDALPGINQDSVPARSPIESKQAGHACGHNLFGAGSVSAAIAVKHWLQKNKHDGVIRLYGTPAEEGGSGKVYMVRAGLFDDVDVALHWHPADENSANARTSLANRSAKFRFYGQSAHAAAAPEKARSALDGVEAFNHMANLMREHVPQQTRMHYVITSGGEAPNVVPDYAEVFYYLRHPHSATLTELWERLAQAAEGAATGTGTRMEYEIIHGNHPMVPIQSLAKMVQKKLTLVGGITYTKAEQKFAEQIYATLNQPKRKLGSEKTVEPYSSSLGYGSTDVGDVSIKVPTVGFRTASYVPGTSSHSWQAVAASGMSIGFKGAERASKVLTLAAIELYENTALIEEATREHQSLIGEDFVYEALLGDRSPPLDYRK